VGGEGGSVSLARCPNCDEVVHWSEVTFCSGCERECCPSGTACGDRHRPRCLRETTLTDELDDDSGAAPSYMDREEAL